MKKKRILIVLFFAAIFILLLISLSLNWVAANFGGVGFDEIMFHLNMPMKGANSYVDSYIKKTLLPAIGILVEIIVGIFFVHLFLGMKPDLKKRFMDKIRPITKHGILIGIVFVVIWFSAAAFRAQSWFGFMDYMKSMIQQSAFFEKEYVDPVTVSITFPEKKRNLIYILMESAESSSQDAENGGLMPVNYIPEMTEIAKNNISFSQSDLIEGAAVPPLCGWTMAGIVAESAGLPLKLYGVHKSAVDNSMKYNDSFMPGVTGLGDILEEQGYHNVFMCGSDVEFGGRENYFHDHGNYELLDYYEAVQQLRIPSTYYVWWGFEDQKLYEWAKEELAELGSSDQPFNFTLLTVDTHSQDGFVCDLCQNEYNDQYANVWRCASAQVDEFVKWCQEQPFYENTTIIIAGDHCSMDKDFYGEYEYAKYEGESVRKVYNAFLNSAVVPVQEKNRKFTTLDLFPSTLAALGCQIEGEHLGLGVNLFSNEETLAEQYGFDYMFEEMRKQSAFYNKELLYPEKKQQ